MKRGQATAFVVLGIILVALGGLTYVLKDKIFKSEWERQRESSLAVPEYAKKVTLFTESCMEQTLKEGTLLLASHGGYINLPLDPMPESPINPFSNSLNIFKSGNNRVAYWIYETANGVQKNQIPTTQNIKQQLENYLKNNLNNCIKDFSVLKNQGYSISYGLISPEVLISDDNIRAAIKFPVVVDYNNQKANIDAFYSSIDYSLGRLIKQALNIIKMANNNSFIENYAIDVMSIYDSIPFSGIDFECTPRTWKRSDVLNSIQNAFAANIPNIKVEGADFQLSNDFNKYFIVPSDEIYTGTKVQFMYSPDWPMLVDILDENSPVLQGKPYTMNNDMSRFLAQFFCINDYHFVYDIKFPVLITITDKNNNPFQFAVMAIIDNNQPRQNTLAINTYDTSSPICEHKTTPIKVQAFSMTSDGSLQPVPNAMVSLKCITASCPIGNTDSTGTLLTNFPQCTNALLTIEKEGFNPARETISTNTEAYLSQILEPIYTINADVKVIDNNNIRPLQPTEQAFFTFEDNERQYSAVFVAPGQNTINLIAGNYEIKSNLIVSSDPPFNIPAKDIEVCNDLPKEGVLGIIGLKEKKCVTQHLDEVSLPQVASGGSSIYWSPSILGLANAKKITLYVVRSETPRSIEDLSKNYESSKKNAEKTKEPLLE